MGFGKDYVDLYYNKTKHAVFLHYLRTKTELPVGIFDFKAYLC